MSKYHRFWPIEVFRFNPEQYFGDNLSCAESVKLPEPMEQDRWTFGAVKVIFHDTN